MMNLIREAKNLDRESIREVHLRAFSEVERQIVSTLAVNLLFVYGDPKYYGKFGFKADTASRYTPPYKLQYPFGWQAITLNEVGFAESNAKISCVATLCDPELW